jgi:hypothetical protein
MLEVILAKIPAHWLLFFATWGLWAFDMYGRISKQFWRTYMALMGSFMEEIVGWPLDSPYPIPLTDYYTRGIYFYAAEYYTKFNISLRQILFVDHNVPMKYEQWKNPYLAISVLEHGQEIADMSNWIETVKVNFYSGSEYFVPLHILLLSYAYENNLNLKLSDIQNYEFSVITMTGDCQTVNIRGVPVHTEVAQPMQEEETKDSEEEAPVEQTETSTT